jgi:hypothetical protein
MRRQPIRLTLNDQRSASDLTIAEYMQLLD